MRSGRDRAIEAESTGAAARIRAAFVFSPIAKPVGERTAGRQHTTSASPAMPYPGCAAHCPVPL
jgi:hypothetical protein